MLRRRSLSNTWAVICLLAPLLDRYPQGFAPPRPHAATGPALCLGHAQVEQLPRAATPHMLLRKRVNDRGHEYRIPARSCKRCRLRTVGGDAQRGMGFLQRLWQHRGCWHLKMLPGKGARLLGPRPLENRQRLLKALPASIVGHVQPLEMDGDGAPSHAQLQPALA